MHLVVSIRPSVNSLRPGAQRSKLGAWLCRVLQRGSLTVHGVCLSNNRVDVDHRLLIQFYNFTLDKTLISGESKSMENGRKKQCLSDFIRIRPLLRMQEMAFLVFNESGSP